MKTSRPPGAFTVLEMLVAAAVFLMMATLLFSIMSQVNAAWQQADGQKNRRELGRALVDLMARDLQGAIPPLPGSGTNVVNFELETGAVGIADSDCVFWQTRLPANRARTDVMTVGYYVGTNHEFYRAAQSGPLPSIVSEAAGLGATNGVLAEGVIRMAVQAFNRDGSTSSGSAVYTTNLPSAIEVTLAIADGRTLARNPSLAVPDFNDPPQGVHIFRSRIDLPCSQ